MMRLESLSPAGRRPIWLDLSSVESVQPCPHPSFAESHCCEVVMRSGAHHMIVGKAEEVTRKIGGARSICP